MNEAAKHFIGTHDFTGFCSQKTEVEAKYVRYIKVKSFKQMKGLTML